MTVTTSRPPLPTFPRALILILLLLRTTPVGGATTWEAYGGDAGSQRYSTADQITPQNVARLAPVWTNEHGLTPPEGASYAYGLTPIYADGSLFVCTPFNHVLALDPATGKERWRFDPEVDRSAPRALKANCRGVTLWRDTTRPVDAACATRIFSNSIDVRLFALDAKTGEPCSDFGKGGIVDIGPTKPEAFPGEFSITSPPILIGDVVVVGSAIADNARADAPRGTVRAFDARTGAPRWNFEPIPQSADDPVRATWLDGSYARAGHANVWSVMTTDEDRGLIFLPVSSASPDYFGGDRPGDNRYANSIVALRGNSGEVAWSFQVVHHDIWDYDLAAPPLLTQLRIGGRVRDVVVANTKQGYVFVLDRDSGEPVFPVVETPFPASSVPGEKASATQPVPSKPPPLVPQSLTADEAWGRTPEDLAACRSLIENARSEGMYTPPSIEGTIVFPGAIGGVNWGGGAVDPKSQTLVVATNRFAHLVTLFPDWSTSWFLEVARSKIDPINGVLSGFGRVPSSPYGLSRVELRAPSGMPCNAPPWSTLTAVDLGQGRILWEVPLGESHGVPNSGAIGVGGPIVTASGVVFVAAGTDEKLRAYALADGRELFSYPLPAGGHATPMTFVHEGRQYVLIAAGGNSWLKTKLGDSLIAFALPE